MGSRLLTFPCHGRSLLAFVSGEATAVNLPDDASIEAADVDLTRNQIVLRVKSAEWPDDGLWEGSQLTNFRLDVMKVHG